MQKRPINSTGTTNKKKTQTLSPPFLACTPFLWCCHLLSVLLDPKVDRFNLPQAEKGVAGVGGCVQQVVTVTPEVLTGRLVIFIVQISSSSVSGSSWGYLYVFLSQSASFSLVSSSGLKVVPEPSPTTVDSKGSCLFCHGLLRWSDLTMVVIHRASAEARETVVTWSPARCSNELKPAQAKASPGILYCHVSPTSLAFY